MVSPFPLNERREGFRTANEGRIRSDRYRREMRSWQRLCGGLQDLGEKAMPAEWEQNSNWGGEMVYCRTQL